MVIPKYLILRTQSSGFHPPLFRTRSGARAYIREQYEYIKHREDFRRQPHGWKLPRAVRVRMELRDLG